MADQVRVFVSHHHSPEEDSFTARLVADLEAAGADVWVDTGQISSGNFVQMISEGMEGRQWLVLVMTPQSVASRWVRNEVNTALSEHTAGRMLGVIPIVMTPTPEQNIPMLWRPLHRYDATRAYEPAQHGLVRALGLGLSTWVPPQPDTLSRQPEPHTQAPPLPRTSHLDHTSREALDSVLQDVEHDRDALSNFLYHVELGDESEHVISQAAGLDIWYDDVLATRALPSLRVDHNILNLFRILSISIYRSPVAHIEAALSKLLRLYERLPHVRQALAEELTHGEGLDLWRDYLTWEEADKLNADDPVSHWYEREQLGRRWYVFKSTSQISQRREECIRAFVEAREQCETIMSMATKELEKSTLEG